MGIETIIGGVAGIGSALIGSSSAKKATSAQVGAANADRALQKEIYENQTERFNPFYETGLQYGEVRNYLDGIGPRPTFGATAPQIETINVPGTPGARVSAGGGGRNGNGWGPAAGYSRGAGTPGYNEYQVGGNTFATLDEAQAWADANKTGGTPYEGMRETDAYKFRFDQGNKAVEASAAARGGLYSGRTMQDLQTYGQGQADQFENNYYSRIAGGAAQGQAAAAQQAQAAQNYGQASSNAFSNIGNAQAAGAIGVGNALQGGLNTGIGLYNYQKNLNTTGTGGNVFGNLFG